MICKNNWIIIAAKEEIPLGSTREEEGEGEASSEDGRRVEAGRPARPSSDAQPLLHRAHRTRGAVDERLPSTGNGGWRKEEGQKKKEVKAPAFTFTLFNALHENSVFKQLINV